MKSCELFVNFVKKNVIMLFFLRIRVSTIQTYIFGSTGSGINDKKLIKTDIVGIAR